MKELALHVYDLVENATAAGARRVGIGIVDSLRDDLLHITIEDDGCGMEPALLARATDPFTTTRTTRRVGFGLSLAQANAERCDGSLHIGSAPGRGTRLDLRFRHSHIDRPPMGDLSGALALLMAGHPSVRFTLDYRTDHAAYTLDTDDLREALGPLPRGDRRMLPLVKEMIAENLKDIKAND